MRQNDVANTWWGMSTGENWCRTPPKSGYISICQSHVTKYKWRHNHLQRDAPEFFSKKWIYCPNLVTIASLIMVLERLKRYSIFSIFFELTERQHVAEERSENLKTTSALCFYTFFIILINFNKSNFLKFFIVFSLNFWSLKRFLINRLDKAFLKYSK